jgi:putative hydrolase of HD superfamily
MLNQEEKQELEGMRQFVSPSDRFTRRLIELERKDTLELAAAFLDRRAGELDACGNLTSAAFGRIYRDEATAIRGLDVNESAADFEAEPTKEQIPNLGTCGAARARPETEEVVVPALFDLAALSLQFGRTNRITYHEDGVTPESDTDHTVMLGLCACAFAKRFAPRLDLGLVAQFAFVHDLAEALCGDTNTLRIDMAGREEKERREEVARQEIRERFSRDLPWVPETLDRYERLEDPEARFVKVLDKVLPKITHALNKGVALREHGVDLSGLAKVNGSQREVITRTYGADQHEAVALLFAVHEELVRRLAQ